MIARRWRQASILDRAGDVLAEVRATFWPVQAFTSPGGQRYEYRGCCTAEAREHVIGKQNRVLAFDEGDQYRIVNANNWPSLGYVELALVQVKADG